MFLFFLACAELSPSMPPADDGGPGPSVHIGAAAPAVAAASDTGVACGGTAPMLGAAAAAPDSFSTPGGVELGEDGVVDATIATSLAWVTLSAPVTDPDGDLHAWTVRVWLAPADLALDLSGPPTGEETGGAGEACTVSSATPELVLMVDGDFLRPATAYHAWLSVLDAGGQAICAQPYWRLRPEHDEHVLPAECMVRVR